MVPCSRRCNTIQELPAKCTVLRLHNADPSNEMLKYQVDFPTGLFSVHSLKRLRRRACFHGKGGPTLHRPSASEITDKRTCHGYAVTQGSLHFLRVKSEWEFSLCWEDFTYKHLDFVYTRAYMTKSVLKRSKKDYLRPKTERNMYFLLGPFLYIHFWQSFDQTYNYKTFIDNY